MEKKQIKEIPDIKKACQSDNPVISLFCQGEADIINEIIKSQFSGEIVNSYNQLIKNPKNSQDVASIIYIFLNFLRYEKAIIQASIVSRSAEVKKKAQEMVSFIVDRRNEILKIDLVKNDPILRPALEQFKF